MVYIYERIQETVFLTAAVTAKVATVQAIIQEKKIGYPNVS